MFVYALDPLIYLSYEPGIVWDIVTLVNGEIVRHEQVVNMLYWDSHTARCRSQDVKYLLNDIPSEQPTMMMMI